MQIKSLEELGEETLKALLNQIPFFNDLAMQDYQQFELLLQHSNIVELDPGEVLMKKGSIDQKFYFLLKGNLDVFPDETPGDKAIGQLSQGQVLGALSIINEQPRTATLAANNVEKATLFSTDFSIFGELDDFSQIKLTTKLSLLRIVINNTRFKLEVNRMNEPDHELAKKLAKVEKFDGEKGTAEELDALAEQAFFLGQLLDLWNNVTVPTINLPDKIESKEKKGLFGFLGKKKKG
jgi:hypothetical protein